MPRTLIPYLSLCFFVLLALSPLPLRAEEEAAAPPQEDYPGVVQRHLEWGGQGKPELSFYYPQLGQPAVDDALSRWATRQVEAFKSAVREQEEDAGKEAPDETFGYWTLMSRYSVSRPSEDVASVTLTLGRYMGGAHGHQETACFNFRLSTGQALGLADLFEDSEQALRLMSAWSRKALQTSLEIDPGSEDGKSRYAQVESGTESDEENFSCLTLTPEGLRLTFDPYQVASYADGAQQVDMPLAELATARPRAQIWKP